MLYAPAVCREVGREFPDCSQCQGRDELRAAWGCDEPAAEPVFSVTCSACAGERCEECNFTGEVAFHTCPSRALDSRPDILEAVRLYQAMSERHLLPRAGGLEDQACALGRVWQLVDDERGRIDRVRDDHRLKAMAANAARRQQ